MMWLVTYSQHLNGTSHVIQFDVILVCIQIAYRMTQAIKQENWFHCWSSMMGLAKAHPNKLDAATKGTM